MRGRQIRLVMPARRGCVVFVGCWLSVPRWWRT